MIWVYIKKFETTQRFKPQQSRPYIAQFLSDFLNQPVKEADVVYSPKGQPLVEKEKVYFSVSHSGPFLVVACSKQNRLGVDVQISTENVSPGVLESTVTQKERSQSQWQQGDVQFFDVWAIKEAATKYTGDGLSFPLDQIEVNFLQESLSIASFHLHYKKIEFVSGAYMYLVLDKKIKLKDIKVLER